MELPWRQKNRHEKHQTRQENNPWRLAAKQNPPKIESQGNPISLAASRQGSRKFYNRQGYNFPGRSSTAKDITFFGGRQQPRKVIYLAGINRQGNAYRQQKKYNRH